MRNLTFSLIVFCALTNAVSCSEPKKSDKTKEIDLESVYKQNLQESVLATGWYYILENENGFKRQLDKTKEFYFIDPKPILVKAHFGKVKMYISNFKGWNKDDIGLSMQVKKEYEDLWASATEKSIGKKLGFVINDKLVNAPMANMRIENGMSSLNRMVYSKKELKALKKQLYN